MSRRTEIQILASMTSVLVQEHDVTDALVWLLRDCAGVLDATAVGLLVRSDTGEIELLSSTSHHVAELELFQIQQDVGPCIDAVTGDAQVSMVGVDQLVAGWPGVGRSITEAGYAAVHASPLRWHGQCIGALNAFFANPVVLTDEQLLVAQAFADLAALVVMRPEDLGEIEVGGRVASALAGRSIVEQAKGVIAQQRGVDMPSAYDVLVEMASQHQASLRVVAEDFIRTAQQGSLRR